MFHILILSQGFLCLWSILLLKLFLDTFMHHLCLSISQEGKHTCLRCFRSITFLLFLFRHFLHFSCPIWRCLELARWKPDRDVGGFWFSLENIFAWLSANSVHYRLFPDSISRIRNSFFPAPIIHSLTRSLKLCPLPIAPLAIVWLSH